MTPSAGQGPGLQNQAQARTGLRVLGGVLLAVGGTMTVIGMLDFLSSFGGNDFGFPTLFILAVIGMPIASFGWKLLIAGYLQVGSRYLAGETAPVAKDTIEYLGYGQAKTKCAHCGAESDAEAKFCDDCGKPMTIACAECDTANDARAKYCDECGAALPQAATG